VVGFESVQMASKLSYRLSG